MAWDEAVAEAARARGHLDVGVTFPPSLSSRYSPASPWKRSFHPLISEPPSQPPTIIGGSFIHPALSSRASAIPAAPAPLGPAPRGFGATGNHLSRRFAEKMSFFGG